MVADAFYATGCRRARARRGGSPPRTPSLPACGPNADASAVLRGLSAYLTFGNRCWPARAYANMEPLSEPSAAALRAVSQASATRAEVLPTAPRTTSRDRQSLRADKASG